MSTRTNLKPHPVIGTLQTAAGVVDSGVSGDVSQASITSQITLLQTLTVGSYAYSWSGSSPNGTIQVLISNDYAAQGNVVINAGTWTPMYFTVNGSTSSNTLTVSGNTGTGIVEWSTGCNAIKTVYTKVSGTGSLSAVICGKVT